MTCKAYVKVLVEINTVGEWRPVTVTWTDGRKFDIDKVTDVRRAASQKAGGTGMRYTCMIRKKPVLLFYEDPRWFVEAK